MSEYIVCQKKRNSPRLSTRICVEKCPDKDECAQFQEHLKKHIVPSEPSVFQGNDRSTALSTV